MSSTEWTIYHLVPNRAKYPGWDAYLYYLARMIELSGDSVSILSGASFLAPEGSPAIITGVVPHMIPDLTRVPDWIPIVAHSVAHARAIYSSGTITPRPIIAATDAIAREVMRLGDDPEITRCPIPYVRQLIPDHEKETVEHRAVFMGRLHVSKGLTEALQVNHLLDPDQNIAFYGKRNDSYSSPLGAMGRWKEWDHGPYLAGEGPSVASKGECILYLSDPLEGNRANVPYVALEAWDAGVPVIAWSRNCQGREGQLLAGLNCIGVDDPMDLACFLHHEGDLSELARQRETVAAGEDELSFHCDPALVLGRMRQAMRLPQSGRLHFRP